MQQTKYANRFLSSIPIIAAAFLLAPAQAQADSILVDGSAAYTGSTGTGGTGFFTADDNEVLWQFQLTGPATFTAVTTSFAAGGFAPNLTLFHNDLTAGDPTGLFIAQGAEGSAPNCGARSVDTTTSTGFCLDSILQATLDAGYYLLVLTEDPNVSFGDGTTYDSGAGFQLTGFGNFTGEFFAANNSQPDFWLFDNTPRTGLFAVTADAAPAVPEPGSIVLMLSGLVVAAGFRFRKN